MNKVYYDKRHRCMMEVVPMQGLRVYWNKQMLSDLCRWYSTTKNEELAEILGVSVRTMIRKARQLGLRKDSEWMHNISMSHLHLANLVNRKNNHPNGFKKGVRSNPEGEFIKGHTDSKETRKRRSQSLKRYWLLHPQAKHALSLKMKIIKSQAKSQSLSAVQNENNS